MTEDTYKRIVLFFRRNSQRRHILIMANKLLTSLVYCLYPGLLLLLIYKEDTRFWKVFFVPGIAFLVVSFFRSQVNALRPYEMWDINPVLDKNTGGKSFPSRHVFSVFVIAMAFYYINFLMGIGIIIIGVLIAAVRVIGGVHFPKDVIAGAVIGFLSGMIGFYIL
ncbi:MAG: phosphatase PAP2 family protein [Halanaerobiaceae bacterium]